MVIYRTTPCQRVVTSSEIFARAQPTRTHVPLKSHFGEEAEQLERESNVLLGFAKVYIRLQNDFYIFFFDKVGTYQMTIAS